MKVEITDLLDLTQEQTALIDMHSVVNIMNVLINELDYLQETFQEGEPLQRAADEIQQINHRLHNSADIETELGNLLKCESHVMKLVHAVLDAHPKAANDSDVRGSVSNLQSVFTILDTRGRELLARVHAPEEWTEHDVEQLTENFTNVLAAIEKNSKGRYRIVHNIAEQERQDYMVTFGIESVDGAIDQHAPGPPGRDARSDRQRPQVHGAWWRDHRRARMDNGKELRFVVEDSGRGIPADEVQQVVEFGKRGSNVDDKATMGGGFGLTKAYHDDTTVRREGCGSILVRAMEPASPSASPAPLPDPRHLFSRRSWDRGAHQRRRVTHWRTDAHANHSASINVKSRFKRRPCTPQAEVWIDIEAADEEGRRWLASQSGLDDEIIQRLLESAPATYWRRFGQGLLFQYAHRGARRGDLDDCNRRFRNLAGARPDHQRTPQ